MPGGGGAGAKCGAPEDEDDVCAEADEAANSERASKQAACFMMEGTSSWTVSIPMS